MGLLTPSNLKTIRFDLKGLNEYLAKIEAAGNSIEEAVREAIPASAQPIYDDIQRWAEEHQLTGTTLKGLNKTKVEQDLFQFFLEVGIDSEIEYNAFHAVFVEYGTPTNAADPGIRRAFEQNKTKVKRIQREILQKRGVPVD